VIAFFVSLVEERRLAVATAGALAIIAGSAAPWAHVPHGTLSATTELGLDADGKITLLLGILALGLVGAYTFLRHRDLAVGAALAAAGSGAYAIVYALDVRRASAEVTARMFQTSPDAVKVQFEASTGIGVWTVIVGAFVLVAACIALLAKAPSVSGRTAGALPVSGDNAPGVAPSATGGALPRAKRAGSAKSKAKPGSRARP
jgi:hypothetical protein